MVYRSYCSGRPTSTHESAPRRYFDSSLSKFYLMSQLPALQLHHNKHCINRCAMEVFCNSDVCLLPSAASTFTSHPCLVRACKIRAQSGQNTRADPENFRMPAKTAAHFVQLCTSSPLHTGLTLPPFQSTTWLGGRQNTRCLVFLFQSCRESFKKIKKLTPRRPLGCQKGTRLDG